MVRPYAESGTGVVLRGQPMIDVKFFDTVPLIQPALYEKTTEFLK